MWVVCNGIWKRHDVNYTFYSYPPKETWKKIKRCKIWRYIIIQSLVVSQEINKPTEKSSLPEETFLVSEILLQLVTNYYPVRDTGNSASVVYMVCLQCVCVCGYNNHWYVHVKKFLFEFVRITLNFFLESTGAEIVNFRTVSVHCKVSINCRTLSKRIFRVDTVLGSLEKYNIIRAVNNGRVITVDEHN